MIRRFIIAKEKMDSHLNLAHQQGRKADMLLKADKFDDAIACHNRAAEHILDAMQQSRSAEALDSLKLQHAFHLKQIDKLNDRQRRTQLLQIKQTKLQLCHQSTQTLLQGPVIAATSEQLSASSDAFFESENFSKLGENSVYRTINGNDSLCGFLLRRQQRLGDISCINSVHSGVPVERVCFTKAGSMKANSEAEFEMEELRINNEDLRQHIQQLLKEVDELKKENNQLKPKMENSQNFFADVEEYVVEEIPDLPPLEMPQFDMNLLLDSKFQENTNS